MEGYDGDSISVYNVDTDGNSKLIVRLSGPDSGPISKMPFSNWEEKVISSSSNSMIVEFKSDEFPREDGWFSATIHFNLLSNKKCELVIDMHNQIFQSQNYPNLYGNDIFCYQLITVEPEFHITVEFLEFDVSCFYNSNYYTLLFKFKPLFMIFIIA